MRGWAAVISASDVQDWEDPEAKLHPGENFSWLEDGVTLP